MCIPRHSSFTLFLNSFSVFGCCGWSLIICLCVRTTWQPTNSYSRRPEEDEASSWMSNRWPVRGRRWSTVPLTQVIYFRTVFSVMKIHLSVLGLCALSSAVGAFQREIQRTEFQWNCVTKSEPLVCGSGGCVVVRRLRKPLKKKKCVSRTTNLYCFDGKEPLSIPSNIGV